MGSYKKYFGKPRGQEVNYSKLGKDIGVTPATGKKWLSILNATYLMCHSLVISSPDGVLHHPAWGHLFESMVIMDIIKKIIAPTDKILKISDNDYAVPYNLK